MVLPLTPIKTSGFPKILHFLKNVSAREVVVVALPQAFEPTAYFPSGGGPKNGTASGPKPDYSIGGLECVAVGRWATWNADRMALLCTGHLPWPN